MYFCTQILKDVLHLLHTNFKSTKRHTNYACIKTVHICKNLCFVHSAWASHLYK